MTSPADLQHPAPEGETLWLHAHFNERLRGANRRLVENDALKSWLGAPVLHGLQESLSHRSSAPDAPSMLDWRTVSFRASDAQVLTSDIVVWHSHEALVTVCAGENDALLHLTDEIGTAAALTSTPSSANAIIASIMAHLVRTSLSDFLEVEQRLADALGDVENMVFSEANNDDLGLIYLLKREVLEAQRAALNNLSSFDALPPAVFNAPLLKVSSLHPMPRSSKARVLALMEQTARRLADSSSLISDIVNVHLNKVSVQQNDDMRKISAWAAMIAVPTLIVGVYGMNFEHMPELTWSFGYPLCVAVMGVLSFVLYRLFKRSGWL